MRELVSCGSFFAHNIFVLSIGRVDVLLRVLNEAVSGVASA